MGRGGEYMLRCDLCKRGCLGVLPLFRGLKATDIQDIKQLVRHRSYEKGEMVVREGDELFGLHIVEAGQAKAFTQNTQGKEYTLRLLQVGDFYGELALIAPMKAPSSLQALTRLKLCSIDGQELRQYLLAHPAAALSILEAMAVRLRQSERLTEELGLLDSRQRVAALLLQLGERQGRSTPEGLKLQLELSRTELANLVGLRQETLSRCLAEFARSRWIKTLGHKTIYITDADALRRIREP